MTDQQLPRQFTLEMRFYIRVGYAKLNQCAEHFGVEVLHCCGAAVEVYKEQFDAVAGKHMENEDLRDLIAEAGELLARWPEATIVFER